MKAESIVFAIAGSLFGLIVGWILGSQQALERPPARPRRRRSSRRRQPRRRRRTAARARSIRTTCRRSGPWPSRIPRIRSLASSSATCTSTPSGTRTRSRGTSRRMQLESGRRQRVDRSRRGLLLHQPARSRDRAVRAVARDRSEAHEDAPQHGHRQGVRQAGSHRRRRGVAAGRGDRARTARRPGRAKKALDGLQNAHPNATPGAPAGR